MKRFVAACTIGLLLLVTWGATSPNERAAVASERATAVNTAAKSSAPAAAIRWQAVPALARASTPTTPAGAPTLRCLKTAVRGRYLYLYIGGFTRWTHWRGWRHVYGQTYVAVHRQLYLRLRNESLSGQQPWTILFKHGRPSCERAGIQCTWLKKRGALMARFDLSTIQYTPLQIAVSALMLLDLQKHMVGRQIPQRLPASGWASVRVPQLQTLSGPPVIAPPQVRIAPGVLTIRWHTNRKTAGSLTLQNPTGKIIVRRCVESFSRTHRLVIGGLAGGRYAVRLRVNDFSANHARWRSQLLKVPPVQPAQGPAGWWLHVAGDQILDGQGHPFRLVGMSRCQACQMYERADFGSLRSQAEHYRRLGINCIRLAISPLGFPGKVNLLAKLGPAKFVRRMIAPDVAAITRAGLYVAIDDHSYPKTIAETSEMIPMWAAIARRFRNDPRVAVYELWNEPSWPGTGLSPKSAAPLRNWYRRCIKTIRHHDKRHIILVSDWNAGWGWATESMWAPIHFSIDAPYDQVAYSKHMTPGQGADGNFIRGGLDTVENRWQVPLIIGEFELEARHEATQIRRALGLLTKDPHDYSIWFWRPHRDSVIYANIWSPWAKRYASRVPFPAVHEAVRRVTRATAVRQLTNLIPNGNLAVAEASASGPADWTAKLISGKAAGTRWTYHTTGGNPGAMFSIETSNSGGDKEWISNAFPVIGGCSYKLSFSYQTDAGGAFVRVGFWANKAATRPEGSCRTTALPTPSFAAITERQEWSRQTWMVKAPVEARFATVALLHTSAWGVSSFAHIVCTPAPPAQAAGNRRKPASTTYPLNGNFAAASPQSAALPADWTATAAAWTPGGRPTNTQWMYHAGLMREIPTPADRGQPTAYVSIAVAGNNSPRAPIWKSNPFPVVGAVTYKLSFMYQANANNTYVRIDFEGGPTGTVWEGQDGFGDMTIYGAPSLHKAKSWTRRSFLVRAPTHATQAFISLVGGARWGDSAFARVALTPRPR